MTTEWESGQLSMFGTGSSEFRDRLRGLRQFRRWDQNRLAQESGLTQPVISQIESGRATVTRDQVTALAGALRYDADFLTADLGLTPTTRPLLRAYADASKREADARTAGSTLAAEYIRRLKLKPIPDLIPRFSERLDDDEAIEDAAMELRQLAQIEEDAVVTNAIRAAERLGCIVLPLESELGRHLGMSVRSDDLPIVCIAKSDVPGDRQRWTVAHELGHLMLHGEVAPPRDPREAHRMEMQAHRFAAAFLGPADPLIQSLNEVGGSVTLRALAEVKATWGISIKALVHRFQELNVIDADHARSLYKQISARKWSKDEPVHVAPESAQWLSRTLTRSAASDDLNAAAYELARSVGGNGDDLRSFADWSVRPDAQVIRLEGHQRGSRRRRISSESG